MMKINERATAAVFRARGRNPRCDDGGGSTEIPAHHELKNGWIRIFERSGPKRRLREHFATK
jgi:hypothetical protein